MTIDRAWDAKEHHVFHLNSFYLDFHFRLSPAKETIIVLMPKIILAQYELYLLENSVECIHVVFKLLEVFLLMWIKFLTLLLEVFEVW